MGLHMSVAAMDLAIARLEARTAVPAWAMAGGFLSITRTPGELSVVAEHTRIPSGMPADGGWCALQVEGPLPLSAVGVLHSISGPLAGVGISIFAGLDARYGLHSGEGGGDGASRPSPVGGRSHGGRSGLRWSGADLGAFIVPCGSSAVWDNRFAAP